MRDISMLQTLRGPARTSLRLRLALAALAALVGAIIVVGVAHALTISPNCVTQPNANDKYFCASMNYSSGATYTIQDVNWGGSRGNGGADQWKYGWGDVWHRVGGTPTYYGSFGAEGTWHLNQFWSGTFSFTGVNWGNLQDNPTVYNCSTHFTAGHFDALGNWVDEVTFHIGWINWLQTGTGQANSSIC